MEEVAVEAAVETVVVEEVGIPDPHRHHHPPAPPVNNVPMGWGQPLS